MLSTTVISFATALLAIFAVLLIIVGSSTLSRNDCQAEPALPKWMVVAGVSLLIKTALTAALLILRKTLEAKKKTLLSVGWAFCCGLFFLIAIFVWLGIWVAGSYFTIMAIPSASRISLNHSAGDDDDLFNDCTTITVLVAGVSVIAMWVVFLFFCGFGLWRLFCGDPAGGSKSASKASGGEPSSITRRHSYNAVPTNC